MTGTMGTNFTVCTLAADINPEIRTVIWSVYGNTTGYAGFVDEIIVPQEAGARAVVNIAEDGINTLEKTAA